MKILRVILTSASLSVVLHIFFTTHVAVADAAAVVAVVVIVVV